MSEVVSSQDSRKVEVRPVRVIAYAWGEKYVDDFLTLTLPALLAPGNLPAVARAGPVDVVLLTEESRFPAFDDHRSIKLAREICPVKLVSLDDLIGHASSYGMSLTYTLHRGFAELGDQMTEHCMVFLNADFVLADGSLSSLIHHLHRGERIVASPSYCTSAEDALPQLRMRTDSNTGVLACSPREMASLILKHRHNSIQGKTLNYPCFHHRYMDQFYWSIGQDVLLGHQMPIAIVGLRPERVIDEPITYWDYGQIREYCPEADVCVLGDSDDFLMLELRSRDAVNDYLAFGPYHPQDLGERMVGWVTDYQRDFAKYPLTLHSVDLPPDTETARASLTRAKDEILDYCPKELPSHVNHPQWEYHKTLTKARRENGPVLLQDAGTQLLPHAGKQSGAVPIRIQSVPPPPPPPLEERLIEVAARFISGTFSVVGWLKGWIRDLCVGLASAAARNTVRAVKAGYKAIFGQLPRVTMLNPNWAAWRHVVRLADEAAQQGVKRALVVSAQHGPIDELANTIAPEYRRLSQADLARSANGDPSILQGEEPFDLCFCCLDRPGLVAFPAMVRALAPRLTAQARVIGFHLPRDPLNACSDIDLIKGTQPFAEAPAVYFTGCPEAVEALELYHRVVVATSTRDIVSILQAPAWLLGAVAKAIVANRSEAAANTGPLARLPKTCTSITIACTPAGLGEVALPVVASAGE